jgi:predicted nucleotidyltransferase
MHEESHRKPPPVDRDQLASRIRELVPDLQYAYLFGSAVTEQARSASDIDIAIATDQPLEAPELGRLIGELEKCVDRPIDLVDLDRAGPILAMQVLRHGELLLEPDHRARLDFEMHTPSRYADWKRMRRPIDRALLDRLSS